MRTHERLTQLLLPASAADPSWRDDLAAKRLGLATLQGESEDLGLSRRAEAFRRLSLMTDVWECLAEDAPLKAREIADFCTEAFEALVDAESQGDDDTAARLLRESSTRWGDYLRLIDPELDSDSEVDPTGGWPYGSSAPEPEPEADRDDAPSAIDAGALFRLLTGDGPGLPARATTPDLFPHSGAWPTFAEETAVPEIEPGPEPEELPAHTAAPFEVPPPPQSLSIDQEMREIFLAEATDLFDRIETLVLSLGRGQRQTETLHEVGRCFHTLKGAAGSVGLLQLAALVHAMEEQLEAVNGEATDTLIDLLHRLLHYLEGVFIALRRSGQPSPEPEPDRLPAEPTGSQGPPSDPDVSLTGPRAVPLRRRTDATGSSQADAEAAEGPVRVSAERIDELMDLASELITRRGLWAAQAEMMKEYATLARTSRNRLTATIDRLRDLRPAHQAVATRTGARRGAVAKDHDADLPELIRRLSEQADDLIEVTDAARSATKPLSDNSDALARLSLQLWESLQAIRIIPVRGLFQRLARVAHDAARVEGRHVEVVMIGEETGVDRAVQDKAFEPLLHVVRNAVCHGIEVPEERQKTGKGASGRITLEASRTGNTLVLSVCDDGRGLDYDAIAAKGRRLGLIEPADIPTVEQLNALIFQSGFSTREAANAIAGRGVGMDVVSQEVGRLHGSIALVSRAGEGTRLSVSLPARLSLQQAMILRVDGQAFALPVELIDLAQPFDPAELDTAGALTRVRMRDQWVPMTSAREALGFSRSSEAVPCPKLLMIRADGGPLAVLVDSISGTCELVLKPLGPLLEGHPLVTGTSLSVTGEVIFALNPAGLARWPRENRTTSPTATADDPDVPRSAPILVVDDSISVRKVVARHLRSLGHEVEEVSDGLEALGKIRNRSYGLVLSDLEMPRMDGFELLAELNRLEIAPAVPVVIASTRSDPETRRRVLGLGAREFIPKPIEPDVLTVLIRGVFPNHAQALAGAL